MFDILSVCWWVTSSDCTTEQLSVCVSKDLAVLYSNELFRRLLKFFQDTILLERQWWCCTASFHTRDTAVELPPQRTILQSLLCIFRGPVIKPVMMSRVLVQQLPTRPCARRGLLLPWINDWWRLMASSFSMFVLLQTAIWKFNLEVIGAVHLKLNWLLGKTTESKRNEALA